jgi:heme oxygenase
MDGIMTALRVLLRVETREVHEALHQLPAFRRLARSTIGRADYAALLWRLGAFYAPLDAGMVAACRRHAAGTGGVVHVRRAPLIARDLADLGAGPEADPGKSAAPGPCLPALDGPAAIAGVLYVVDGALLGGAALGRAVRRLDWSAPCGFWSWCQEDGPALWRRTLSLLERVDRKPADQAVALAAACDTFAAFAGWVGQPSPEPAE